MQKVPFGLTGNQTQHFAVPFFIVYSYLLITSGCCACAGSLFGQLCGEADPLQPPPDGHLRAADAQDGAAEDGGDGDQDGRKRQGS